MTTKRKLPFEIDSELERKLELSVVSNGSGTSPDPKNQVPVRVEDAMKNLHPLEEQVLEYIFFDSKRAPHSLKEAAEKFQLETKEVEDIYAQGLRKLRGGKLKGFPPVSWN